MEDKTGTAKPAANNGRVDLLKAKQEAEEKRKEALEEKRQQAAAQAEARKQAASEKREQALAQIAAKRKEAEEKRKVDQQKKEAKQAVGSAKKSSATISLGFFGFGQKSDDDDEVTEAPKVSNAPKGVPSLSKWKQNGNGSISGLISGSSAYKDGEKITTSAITTSAEGGTVVQTKSGSKYFLEPKAVGGIGLFGIGSPASSASTSTNSSTSSGVSDLAAKRKAQQEEAARKREAIVAAANERRRQAEEKKKQAIEAAVAKRKQQQLAKGLESESKPTKGTQPSRTFSLGFLNFGGQDKDSSSNDSISTSAPRGVPTLTKWRKNRDGSISGSISGSPAFKEGEFVTTSPISGNVVDGAVVTTSSGSRCVVCELRSSKDTPESFLILLFLYFSIQIFP